MLVPGMGNPGRDGVAGYPAQVYLGHYQVYFLDFVDLTSSRTLLAIPGEWYVVYAGSARPGVLTLSGDRWSPSSFVSLYALHGPSLHEGRLHNARLQARLATEHQPERAKIEQQLATAIGVPQEKKEPAPLSEASLMLIAARKLNAELQAQRSLDGS